MNNNQSISIKYIFGEYKNPEDFLKKIFIVKKYIRYVQFRQVYKRFGDV